MNKNLKIGIINCIVGLLWLVGGILLLASWHVSLLGPAGVGVAMGFIAFCTLGLLNIEEARTNRADNVVSDVEDKCTYCEGMEFFEGPSAGLSVMVLCANAECRHHFTSSPAGLSDSNRIEPKRTFAAIATRLNS